MGFANDPGAATDDDLMRRCLAEAEAAGAAGEVPIGALIVRNGEVLAVGRNAPIALNDPTAHAEIAALRAAATQVGNYRLPDADLFVTVEPCLMCVGALLHARIRRVVFGCRDPKAGALGSIADFSAHPALNHRLEVTAGVCEEDARALLQTFFRSRRKPSV